MSGIEQSTVTWLNIAVSAGAIIGGVVTLVRYLKKERVKDVAALKTELEKGAQDTREQIGRLMERIQTERSLTNESINHLKESLQSIRGMIENLEGKIKENREVLEKSMDTNTANISQRIDLRYGEIRALEQKVDKLKEDYHRLELEVVKKSTEQIRRERIEREEEQDFSS